MAREDLPLLNQEQIDILLMIAAEAGASELVALRNIFLTENLPRFDTLIGQIEAGDFIAAAKTAHAVAGAAGNLGMLRLSESLRGFERAVKSDDLPGAIPFLEGLDILCAESLTAMDGAFSQAEGWDEALAANSI